VPQAAQAYPYKEIVPPQPEYYAAEKRDDSDQPEAQRAEPHKKERKRVFGCIPLWICICLIVVVIIALALGIGLGVGLGKKYVSKLCRRDIPS
jgi:hypothetical protein